MSVGINFDTVLRELLCDMAEIVTGWANGSPKDESALLNRMTETLSRKRRKCDVGVKNPVAMTAQIHELHRRGAKSIDKFGADFAVTICIEDGPARKPTLLKTALFQLKISSGYSALLEAGQLKESQLVPQLKDRTFVLAVDSSRFGYRIDSAHKCLGLFENQQTKNFATNEWEFLSDWLSGWFSCRRGATSDPDDPNSIERLLEGFKVGPAGELVEDALRANLPPDYVPARCWLKYLFSGTHLGH